MTLSGPDTNCYVSSCMLQPSIFFFFNLLIHSKFLCRNVINCNVTGAYISKIIQEDLREVPGEGNGTPLQYSCLENPTDGGAWWAAVHGVARSRTRLSDFTFTFHFHALEKEMATQSSVLAWRIPGKWGAWWLLSLGSHRVGHD